MKHTNTRKEKSYFTTQLATIEQMTATLDPPVRQFEKIIRTTPLRTLVSVLLSSRTKDAVTLSASEKLFMGINSATELASLTLEEIERRIYPVGFYHQKARQIKRLAQMLNTGTPIIPDRDALMMLPGVGRKTANLVLALAFGEPAIAVDIHVFRISHRLGWCLGKDPLAVENELMDLFDQKNWSRLNQALVAFGQTLCRPIRPACSSCRLQAECPSAI